jgi:hypothetical protein
LISFIDGALCTVAGGNGVTDKAKKGNNKQYQQSYMLDNAEKEKMVLDLCNQWKNICQIAKEARIYFGISILY